MARYLSRETQPYGKWNGIPIYLTTILSAVFVVGLFVSAFLVSANSPLLRHLTFFMPAEGWTVLPAIVTYPFIDKVTFFTPFSILFFYWLGVGIETHLGRSVLAKLLILLTLAPVIVVSAAWWMFQIPTVLSSFCQFGLSGSFLMMAALLMAFATLYPNAEWLGWVPFKWVAFACFVCGSLMAVSHRDWLSVAALWATCLGAFFYMRHAVEQDYDDHIPLATRIRTWFRSKPKLRVVPRPAPAPAPRQKIVNDFDDEPDSDVDTLLDKIAKSGLASLSRDERAKLEKAREALLKKEQR